jgi:tRNA(Ile)-lysidine synthetase-like protein
MTSIVDDIISLWFPNDKYQPFWFSSKRYPRFNDKIATFIQKNEEAIKNTDFFKDTPSIIAGIIYHDQLCRHTEEDIQTHHQLAMELAIHLVINKLHHNLKPEHIVFTLLPFRHTKIREWINFTIQYISTLRMNDPHNHFNRFIKAATKQTPQKEQQTFMTTIVNYSIFDDYTDVLDTSFRYTFEHKFDIYSTKPMKALLEYIQTYHTDMNKKFVISLSGGVDSMLCLVLTKFIPELNVHAIHYNWNQRPESKREASFLQLYCNLNNIPYTNKNITHISRDKDRTEFESEGRLIRFTGYRELNPGSVFLGHHKGDVIENVFTNMIKGSNYLDLGKMNVFENQNGVPICRPFLSVSKDDIYSTARIMNIPFFKDTTPDWSNRGAIRRRIFPQIRQQFHNTYETGFLKMAEKSRQINQLLQTTLINPYWKRIENIKESTFMIPLEYDYPLVFYEMIFERLFHSLGIPRPKQKSISHWYRQIITVQNNPGTRITLTPSSYSQKCSDIHFAIIIINS